MRDTASPVRKHLVEFLVALTAAATFEVLKEEQPDVLNTLRLGSFELYMLWSLCAVLLLSRIAIPRFNEWRRSRYRDWDDFQALENDARSVRDGYLRGSVKDLPEKEQRETLIAEQDLKIHLQLLGVGFYGEHGPDVVTDMALLIKLMQRRDLATARRRVPHSARSDDPKADLAARQGLEPTRHLPCGE